MEDIDLQNFQGAQDAIQIIDKAINDTTSTRGELGALQKNTLESNISTLRIAVENMVASESVIRDATWRRKWQRLHVTRFSNNLLCLF